MCFDATSPGFMLAVPSGGGRKKIKVWRNYKNQKPLSSLSAASPAGRRRLHLCSSFISNSCHRLTMAYFIFVVSGDGSCHRLESRSASVGERRCDISLGSWLKILHLATKTATSFLQIRNHNGSYIVSMGFGGRSEVWRAPYLAIPGAPPLAVPVIESTFLLLYAMFSNRLVGPSRLGTDQTTSRD